MKPNLATQLLPLGLVLAFGIYLSTTGRDVHWGGLVSMLAFYCAIYWLGIWAAQKQRDDSITEMILAGRSIPLGVAALSMTATWVGGGYINGTAEATYASGLLNVQAPWGYALSLVIGGILFAPRMRRFRFTTMLDPLEMRFGKGAAALLYLPALTGEIFWTAAILTALGTTFGTVLGLDFVPSILLSATIAIAYTVVGGLWAVAITDVVQIVILIVGLWAVIPVATAGLGGLQRTWQLYQASWGAGPPVAVNWINWWDSALLLIFGGIPWQVYFQRVLAARDESTARWMSILAGVLCLIAAFPAVVIGAVGRVADWQAVGVTAPEPALVLPYVLRYLTSPFVATVGLGALAAAVMSSVDSSILSASSMAAWNVYRPLLSPKASAQRLGVIIRRSILIVGCVATLIALRIRSVYELWFLCSDFVYCMLFPQLVAALFDRRANRLGCYAGLAVSFVLRFGGGESVLGLPKLLPYPQAVDGSMLFPFRTVAMLAGLVTILVVSRLTAGLAPPVPLRMPLTSAAPEATPQ